MEFPLHSGFAALCVCLPLGCAKPATATQTPKAAQHEPDAAEPAPADNTRYLIDGEPVERATWEALFESMTEEQRDWYCDETTYGGEEGWVATDEAGNEYQVTLTSDSMAGSTMEIRSLSRDAPSPAMR